MGKKPKLNIEDLEEEFSDYLYNHIFNSKEEIKFIYNIAEKSDLLIFGGLIKDFLIAKGYEDSNENFKYKDVDIVLTNFNQDISDYLKKYLIKRNSIGGFKLEINKNKYDIWHFENTWGLKYYPQLDFKNKENLINSSFFNSTAIIYSIKESKFIYNDFFLEFYNKMILDIVFEVNPYPELCILKTLEYYDYYNKHDIKISEKLRNYVESNFEKQFNKLETTQHNYYGKVKYDKKNIKHFYSKLKEITVDKERDQKIDRAISKENKMAIPFIV